LDYYKIKVPECLNGKKFKVDKKGEVKKQIKAGKTEL
jgi:hypothetical protein